MIDQPGDPVQSVGGRTNLSYLNSGVEIGFTTLFALVEGGDEFPFILSWRNEYFWAARWNNESVDGFDVNLCDFQRKYS